MPVCFTKAFKNKLFNVNFRVLRSIIILNVATGGVFGEDSSIGSFLLTNIQTQTFQKEMTTPYLLEGSFVSLYFDD